MLCKTHRFLLQAILGIIATIPAYAQWSSNGDINRGTHVFSQSGGGAVGYSIRTAAGGGWAWQFTDGSNTPYFHVQYPNGEVGVGTSTPRGKFDVDGPGDIYLVDDAINGATAGQNIFLPGHIYLAPHGGGGVAFLQARRSNNSGTLAMRIRTTNNGSLTDALHIEGNGNIGLSLTSPTARLELGSGSVAIQDNNVYKLRGGNNNDTGIGFFYDGSLDEVRISHTRDIYNRFITLGSYSPGGLSWLPHLKINTNNGNVGIGTAPASNHKLAVNGKIWATEVSVSITAPGPDYVFEKDYNLPSIASVKQYVEANKHLEGVPSAKEMEEKGINVSEMNMTLLKKMEELTLYVIELQKQIDEMKKAR